MVCSIAFGEKEPVRKTLSPRRVTSRSSWRVWRRLPRVLAILRRTELEPISTAAKVGISYGGSLHGARAAGGSRLRRCRSLGAAERSMHFEEKLSLAQGDTAGVSETL